DESDGPTRLRAEEADELRQHRLLALFGRVSRPYPCYLAVTETHESGLSPIRRSIIEGCHRRPGITEGLAGEAAFAPERLLIDGNVLDDRTHGHPRREVIALGRQPGLVVNPSGQQGRHGDDNEPSLELSYAGAHRDAI